MTTKFTRLSSVTDLGKEVIREWHPHLIDVKVDFVLRDTVPMMGGKGGKEIWGRAKKITGLNAFLNDPDDDGEFFLIEISGPVWERLSHDERKALLDHELCHCVIAVDEDDPEAEVKLKLKTHDLEEFREIVTRHGLWRPDIEAMATVIDGILEE